MSILFLNFNYIIQTVYLVYIILPINPCIILFSKKKKKKGALHGLIASIIKFYILPEAEVLICEIIIWTGIEYAFLLSLALF